MMKPDKQFRISTVFLVAIGTISFIASAVLILLLNHHEKKQALLHAEGVARVLLERNLATHTYFTKELKPALFTLTTPLTSQDYFDPTWMSSTFAVRRIEKYFQALHPSDYYYKECAINARSPENEADAYEKAFIEKLKADSGLMMHSDVRRLNGKPYFVVLRRGEVMEATCLRCHDTPVRAPANLVQQYGAERSFHRKEGELVSAISIRVPLSVPYAEADKVSFRLSAFLLAVMLVHFSLLYWLNKKMIFSPLNTMREKAMQIATDAGHLGEKLFLPSGRELQELSSAFNAMSESLRKSRDHLEELVKERTAELRSTNVLLQDEITERRKTEAERENLIRELREALARIKTLSGMLPICASCKKIRDDKGYWSQIEEYISEHSDAAFTHGICPECMKKLYPDYYKEGE